MSTKIALIAGDSPLEFTAPDVDEDVMPLRTGTLGTFALSIMIAPESTDPLRKWSGDGHALWAVDGQTRSGPRQRQIAQHGVPV